MPFFNFTDSKLSTHRANTNTSILFIYEEYFKRDLEDFMGDGSYISGYRLTEVASQYSSLTYL